VGRKIRKVSLFLKKNVSFQVMFMFQEKTLYLVVTAIEPSNQS